MITLCQGSIFDSDCLALVVPVNCVGVSGKGLALEFKKRYPASYNKYRSACKSGEFKIGRVLPIKEYGKWIVHFPTKEHWSHPSEYEYIGDGLITLATWIQEAKIESVAIPALGCGLGGLEWSRVQQMIEETFSGSTTRIDLYPPK